MNSRPTLPILHTSSEPQKRLTRREVLQLVFAGMGASLAAPLAAEAHPVLRRRHFFHGAPIGEEGRKDVMWIRPDGSEVTEAATPPRAQKLMES